MATPQYAPWSSDVELSFYSALASQKVDHDKLDDSVHPIVGRYEVRPSDAPERSARMQIHGDAFFTGRVPPGLYRADGYLKNANTIEEYKTLFKSPVLEEAGRHIWEAITNGSVYSNPSILASFYAIFFADLKKYKFLYQFCFPALHADPPWKITNDTSGARIEPSQSTPLCDAVQSWKKDIDQRQHGFFLAKRVSQASDGSSLSRDAQATSNADRSWVIASISKFEEGFFDNVDAKDRFVCFADPSTYPQNPGWMLRNLLVLVQRRWRFSEVQIICYRQTQGHQDRPASLVLNMECDTSSDAQKDPNTTSMPKVTGRERNESNKISSKVVDLAEYMDPEKLADQSVDLNLKLMKWRLAPELDLDTIRNTKCLLLGAGTLGSYVSRNLLGWGVRTVTLVDNAKVSFSNPVRQPLFGFEDCKNGGARKAQCAANALKAIYPGVNATGYDMSVPMAGHPVMDEQKVKEEFEQLDSLIGDHDAVFLLMDSRESRWLPSVIGKAKGKIVMTAALGFDTYVVMRHGASTKEGRSSDKDLGCYFCNDVVAPIDSMRDLTLDQQCTVTRPGIAAIASALCVELLVSVLQHPLGPSAPAPASRSSERSPASHPLGLVPHQIRGYLASFDNMIVHGPSYDCCSACSAKVVTEYERNGWEFVKRALNESGYVEELSGLAEVQRKAEEAARELEMIDDEDEDFDELA
ncbi:MAG: Autophagy protein 7 [Alyxoria varia]|nr:MAG: Autophagy protein 7 [Alyxoria varia]